MSMTAGVFPLVWTFPLSMAETSHDQGNPGLERFARTQAMVPKTKAVAHRKMYVDISSATVYKRQEARILSPPDDATAESIQLNGDLVALVGGYINGFQSISRSIQFFNVTSQQWLVQKEAKLPLGIAETHQGLAFDEATRYLYIVSGQLGPGCLPATRNVTRFHVETRVFQQLPDLPIQRYAPGTVLVPSIGGENLKYLHVFGGASQNRNDSATDHWRLAIDESQGPSEWIWESLEPLPDGGTHGSSFLSSNGYIYYTGFCNLDPGVTDSPSMAECNQKATLDKRQELNHVSHGGIALRYPAAVQEGAKDGAHWERVADMPFPVCHGGSIVHDGKLYLLGGSILTRQKAKGSAPRSWPSVQVYDPGRDSWEFSMMDLPPRTNLFLLSTWVDMQRSKIFSVHPNNAVIQINLSDKDERDDENASRVSIRLRSLELYIDQTARLGIQAFKDCLEKDHGNATSSPSLISLFDPSYEDVRGTWNKRNAHKQYPHIVARPNQNSQISSIADCASRTGYRVCGRNGRHSYDGNTCTHGIVVDVSGLRQVHVDSTQRTAWLGAGLTLGKVAMELEKHGFVLPMGTCSSVGLTGLTLNGGQGPLTRWSGLTSDHLHSVELIDRTGRSIVANASNEYSDLLWLARGGGSVGYHYPGIITGLKFDNLVPIRRNETLWTRVRLSFTPVTVERAVELLRGWQAFFKVPNCEDDLCRRVTAEPWLFLEYKRRARQYMPALRLVIYFFGTESEHSEFVRMHLPPLQGLIPGGKITSMERLDQLNFHRKVGGLGRKEDLSLPYKGHDLNTSWLGLSAVAAGESVEDETFREISNAIYLQEPKCRRYAEFKPLGGRVLSNFDANFSAFWHRQANWWVLMNHFLDESQPAGDRKRQEDIILEKMSTIVDTMGESFQGHYAGYAHHSNSTWRDLKLHYGGHASRIRDIKRQYDPHNLFRNYLPNNSD